MVKGCGGGLLRGRQWREGETSGRSDVSRFATYMHNSQYIVNTDKEKSRQREREGHSGEVEHSPTRVVQGWLCCSVLRERERREERREKKEERKEKDRRNLRLICFVRSDRTIDFQSNKVLRSSDFQSNMPLRSDRISIFAILGCHVLLGSFSGRLGTADCAIWAPKGGPR